MRFFRFNRNGKGSKAETSNYRIRMIRKAAHASILRNSAFATFSSVERGISSTKRISRGTLKSASELRQAAMTVSCSSVGAGRRRPAE